MSKKQPNSKQSLAIFAPPICISLGASLGLIFGSVAGSISMGVCYGLIGGAGVGMILFGILYSMSDNKEDK